MDMEIRGYSMDGWEGPFPLLTSSERTELVGDYLSARSRFAFPRVNWHEMSQDAPPTRWFKSLHWNLPSFAALAQRAEIVDRVREILGPVLLAWGATVIERGPGESHRWHVDIEHVRCPGVSAYIALEGISCDSTLNVIPGSHTRILSDSEHAILSQLGGRGGTPLPLADGEFCLLSGALWHGSHNSSPTVRRSILIQYTTPDYVPGIPLTWDDKPVWHPQQPPSLLLCCATGSRWIYAAD